MIEMKVITMIMTTPMMRRIIKTVIEIICTHRATVMLKCRRAFERPFS